MPPVTPCWTRDARKRRRGRRAEEADAAANEGLEMENRRINDTEDGRSQEQEWKQREIDGLSKRRTEDGWINRNKTQEKRTISLIIRNNRRECTRTQRKSLFPPPAVKAWKSCFSSVCVCVYCLWVFINFICVFFVYWSITWYAPLTLCM